MIRYLLCAALLAVGCSQAPQADCTGASLVGSWTSGTKDFVFDASCAFTYVDGTCAANGVFGVVGATLTLTYASIGTCPDLNVLGDTFSFSVSGTTATINGDSYSQN